MSRVPIAPPPDEGSNGVLTPATDTRPAYSPTMLVVDVRNLLRGLGIATSDDASMHLASLAAADLLRALGIRPAALPDAPPKAAPLESARCRYCGALPTNGRMLHVPGCRRA